MSATSKLFRMVLSGGRLACAALMLSVTGEVAAQKSTDQDEGRRSHDASTPELFILSPKEAQTVVAKEDFTVEVLATSLKSRVSIMMKLVNAAGTSEKIERANQQQVVRFNLKLAQGENTVTIVAASEMEAGPGNERASPPLIRTLIYTPRKSALNDLLYLGIGVSSYGGVEDLERLFKTQEDGRIFDSVDAQVIKDVGATRAAVIKGLRWIVDKADESDDVGLVFVAGNVERGQDGEYYLHAYDHKEAEADLEAYDVPFATFLRVLSTTRGRIILFVDASAPSVERSLATFSQRLLENDSGRLLVCSTTSEAKTAGTASGAVKHFTLAEVASEGLKGTGDLNKDGFVDTLELRGWLDSRMRLLTEGRQSLHCSAGPNSSEWVFPIFSYQRPS